MYRGGFVHAEEGKGSAPPEGQKQGTEQNHHSSLEKFRSCVSVQTTERQGELADWCACARGAAAAAARRARYCGLPAQRW